MQDDPSNGANLNDGGSDAHASCRAEASRRGDASDGRAEREALRSRLSRIGHKIIVLSGKGGVGKSTIAVNLAVSLMRAGKRVGLLDTDMHGPSVPRMLGLGGQSLAVHEGNIVPAAVGDMKVVSIALLVDADDAVIWRGPLKMSVIRQFLCDVEWGDLDYLVVDAPPGTGDEPLSICQLIDDADGAVVVTTPQHVALDAVRRSVTFCRQLGLPVLGVVENMSGLVCPHCGKTTEVFGSGGGERLAAEMDVAFLGRIPMDPAVGEACDVGKACVDTSSRTASAFAGILAPILALDGPAGAVESSIPSTGKEDVMRFAIPVANGRLSTHFGHCERFSMIDADLDSRQIVKEETVDAPDHQPGLLPRWLSERGVNTVIAGGMGTRAQQLFAANGIAVVTGAPAAEPRELVHEYLAGTLLTGDNLCDH